MGSDDPLWLAVGHVRKPHGTRGELYVQSLTDHPEAAFAPGVELQPGDAERGRPDPDFPALTVESSRPHREGWLVRFAGLTDRSAADLFRGAYLLRPESELVAPGEGEVFYHRLLGLEVVTAGGEPLGRVREVYELRPADLLEVVGGGRSVLVPMLSTVVVDIDLEGGRIVVDPPEGLLDE